MNDDMVDNRVACASDSACEQTRVVGVVGVLVQIRQLRVRGANVVLASLPYTH